MLCSRQPVAARFNSVRLLLQYRAHPEGEHFRACVEALGHCVRRQVTADLASRSSPPK